MKNLADIQAAAKLIEADGAAGFRPTAQRYGEEIAIVLLVAHLRRAYGSMESYPAAREIDQRVEEHLEKMGVRIS